MDWMVLVFVPETSCGCALERLLENRRYGSFTIDVALMGMSGSASSGHCKAEKIARAVALASPWVDFNLHGLSAAAP